MKKTWSTLGINKKIHNICFTWVLFQNFVLTGQVEGDLLCATLAMLNEVAGDAKRGDREDSYVKMVGSVLVGIKKWAERRLFCYHGAFHRGSVGLMETLLPLVFAAAKILEEDIVGFVAIDEEKAGDVSNVTVDSTGNQVDRYIRSSLKYAFAKVSVFIPLRFCSFGYCSFYRVRLAQKMH